MAQAIEQPNLLEAVDHRIIPEHAANRFRELPNEIGDDGRDRDERAGMLAGERVRRAATGEDGVVSRPEMACWCRLRSRLELSGSTRKNSRSSPRARPSALPTGELGHLEPYGLRLQSLYLKHAYRYDPLTGLSSARIEPQLHQVFVAHRVTQKLQPRMILADEVGLGKTIEAGLIIKELRARELLGRVLIIVPASLQLQWQSELKSKFNEDFEILDGAALQYLGRGKAEPVDGPAERDLLAPLRGQPQARRADHRGRVGSGDLRRSTPGTPVTAGRNQDQDDAGVPAR